ncbi:CPBP family intramembrane glutamic endopeptidase [Microbacterium terricola]|uniref:CAAX prenyl protease 2/Lysostaphin resistance protein A-like domain-containing protein n=1 Tax=Microbacterium terricola TaxID=344163 RepID=A0ABM8DW24_9MICO|nr:type II CAAX endopeptidase family protein [Microbacterium terricola]UYK39482.1 CPBP family intramembrane metalloprotease [Microbacterium terricola]BDV29789.1 hypothetical protein Microterr_04490 [Microbacterium terricola]
MRGWRELLIAWALFSLGAGVLAGFTIRWLWPAASWSSLASTLALWIGMLVPIVMAFSRSRPVGLLRLRPLDLLYGVALGVFLRLFQGWVATMADGGAPFPTFATMDGALPSSWFWREALPAGVIAPVIEEFFFRAVILVAMYTVLRRGFGKMTAGLAAALVSTALFVVLHTVSGTLGIDAVVSLGAVGLTCAALVLLTGRIWAAVIVHVVYNSMYLLLGLVGTFAG